MDIFIKTLQLLYQPDCDLDCKQNVREFLEFLHETEEGASPEALIALKDFVYNAIKNFAQQNQKAYQTSNLIELMNKVVETRRGEIFEDTASVASMTGGGLSGRAEDKSFGRFDSVNNQSTKKFKVAAGGR